MSILAALMVLAAACGGGGAEGDGDAAAGAGGAAPATTGTATEASGPDDSTGDSAGDETDSAAPAPEDAEPFTVGLLACCTVSDVAMLEAIEILQGQGYSIDTPEIAEPELVVEAVATDRFQIGQSATTSIMLAVQQGAPLRAIGERMGNEWLTYSRTEIASCEDLDGARVGIHSEGSSSTAQIRAYINQECPGTEPSWLVVAGAGNRVQAMLAGELDATPLQVDNGVELLNLAPEGEFHELVAFIDSFDIRANHYIASQAFLDDHRPLVELWLATLADIHQQITDDPAYLAELITKHIPDYNTEILDQVAETYSSLGLFAPDLGLEGWEQGVADTIAFYVEHNAVEGLDPDLSAADVIALEPLEAAVGQ